VYVIQSLDTGKYVSSGGVTSYVTRLEEADTFASHADALRAGVCGNEMVVPVNVLLRRAGSTKGMR